jgi:hypothetical protein
VAIIIRREEGSFVKFAKREGSCPLIKPLYVLKKDVY